MIGSEASKLRQIMTAVLELADDAPLDDLMRGKPSQWDSLAQATLNAALEDEFGIIFDLADYEHLTCFKGIEALLSAKLAAGAA